MKDIDFDELDKAVSSLMGSMSNTPATPKIDDENVLSLPESNIDAPIKLNDPLPVVEAPAKDTSIVKVLAPAKTEPSEVTAEPARALSTPPPRPLATRRSGRFMDVVHPSSDMKSTSQSAVAPANSPVSRLGASLAPLNPVVGQKSSESSLPSEVQDPIESSSKAPIANTVVSESWPDPIDFHNALNSDKQDDQTVSKDNVVEDDHGDITTTKEPLDTGVTLPFDDDKQQPPLVDEATTVRSEEDKPDEEPVQSPFLPNVSPEKRPLGGFSAQSANEVSSDIAETDPTTEPKPSLSLEPKKNEDKSDSVERIALPEELSENVLAVESTDAAAHEASTEKNEANSDKNYSSESHEETPAPGQFAGGSSIAPQYKTAKSTGDTHHEALYDSAAISPSVKHAAKKKSGWLGVIIIIALILVGVGGAAALYFSGLI